MIYMIYTVNSFNFVGTNFHGLGRKAFRGIFNSWIADYKKNKEKGFRFSLQSRRFCVSRFYDKVFILSKFTSTPNKYGSLLYIISLLQF